MNGRITAVVLLCACFLSACAGPRPARQAGGRGLTAPGQAGDLVWEFLGDGFDEDVPAPLYGYLLLPTAGLSANRGRRLAEAFWQTLSSHHAFPSGITYWPVQKAARAELVQAAKRRQWQFWIESYHYRRAQVIYQRIQEADERALLIVAPEPLGRLARDLRVRGQEVLLLDLTPVPDEKLPAFFRIYQTEIMQKSGGRRNWEQTIRRLQTRMKNLAGGMAQTLISLKTLE
ncbi:hypothetical protein JW933_04215 [candidate division FCPU426 bacterium]|nr:hypothetical protein [candidate division FCPU426 bacterium]